MLPPADAAHPIVLFDGDCGFCNAWVLWLIARDPGATLRFAPLRSGAGRAALAARGVSSETALGDTMILLDDRGVHVRSAAALRIGAHVCQPWRSLAKIAKLVPRGVSDAIYNVIARHRTRLAGSSACVVPTPPIRARFLTDPE